MFQLAWYHKDEKILNHCKRNNSVQSLQENEKVIFRPLLCVYVCSNLSDLLLMLISETQLFSQYSFQPLQVVASYTLKQSEFHPCWLGWVKYWNECLDS